jgi:hypothetical protein
MVKFVKGQVSSPFELLVAIIIMSFVVIIGANMLAGVNEQVCLAGIDKSLTEFKLKLEDTALLRTSNKFEFRLNTNSCFNENDAIIKIEKYNDSKKCSSICADKTTNSCFVLIFNASDLANGFKAKCLNLQVYTSFVGPDDCPTSEESLNGFESIIPTTNGQMLHSGTYILRNISPAGASNPEICTYVK